MNYSKPIMRMTELQKLGFPRAYLMRAYHTRGQKFARKIDGTKDNSPIIFEVEGFEKWRINNP